MGIPLIIFNRWKGGGPAGLGNKSSLLAYDSYSREDGNLGNTESVGPNGQAVVPRTYLGGNTWQVVSNKVINTPATFGSNLVVNGEFTTNTLGWLDLLGIDIVQVDSSADPGVVSGGADNGAVKLTRVIAEGGNIEVVQTVSPTQNIWYLFDVLAYSPSSNTGTNVGSIRVFPDSGLVQNTLEDMWQNIKVTYRAVETTVTVRGGANSNINGDIAYFDKFQLRSLTLSELINPVDVGISVVMVDIAIYYADSQDNTATQTGLVIRLDSESSPANFLSCYLDGIGNVALDKCVAGVYTNLITAPITFVDGAILRVIADETEIKVYYNGAMVGTPKTVSDAGILHNTKHSPFSTDGNNSLDNFAIWSLG